MRGRTINKISYYVCHAKEQNKYTTSSENYGKVRIYQVRGNEKD